MAEPRDICAGQAEQELNDRERQIFYLECKIMELEDERSDTRKDTARCWQVDSKFDALETQASCVLETLREKKKG